MNTKTLTFAVVAVLLVVSVIAVSETQIAEAKKSPTKFKAKINAEQQVLDSVEDPTLWDDVKAKGHAKFKLSKDGSELKYTIKIRHIENIVGIHIHNGAPGMNHHDHLVDIIPTDLENPVEQKGKHFKISGILTDEDVLPMGGHHGGEHMERTLADLVEAMSNSHAYIQVHTSSDADSSTNTGPGDLYAPGEVRGNIYPGHK